VPGHGRLQAKDLGHLRLEIPVRQAAAQGNEMFGLGPYHNGDVAVLVFDDGLDRLGDQFGRGAFVDGLGYNGTKWATRSR
jgi:hypothetical protein